MSIEFRAIRKKRSSSDTTPSSDTPEGDHRKRRRNRTTQSCLNCHTSKRMCDRKRPCGRCTQLGLTGLCVYEVDDPSRQSDVHDESSRLRQRVAELEGVIRELKNKPHPRWVKSGSSPGEEFEKCHARSQSRPASDDSGVDLESRHHSSPPDPSSTNSNACSNEESLDSNSQSLLNDILLQSSFSPSTTGNSATLSSLPHSPCFDIHSPQSAPSTGLVTPTEEHPQNQVAIVGEQQLAEDMDLASLFISYSDFLSCNEGPGHVDRVPRASQYIDPGSAKYSHGQFLDGHCGCLNEAASYNVVLELSLRLRKAADILSYSANHRFNNRCPLNQKIVGLDTFATTALGNITISPNDFGPVSLRSRANTTASGTISPGFPASNCISSLRAPAISSPSIRGLRPWSATSCVSDSPASCDESFMTWEPSRRG